jgi:hypothetical protein
MVHLLDERGRPLATGQHQTIRLSPDFDFLVLLGEVDSERVLRWGLPVLLTPMEAYKLANGLLLPAEITGYNLIFDLLMGKVAIPIKDYRENIAIALQWSLFRTRFITFLISYPVCALSHETEGGWVAIGPVPM